MTKPGSTSASAMTGLILAAAIFALTLFLNQTRSSSRLIMPMAETGDVITDAADTARTGR